MREAAGDCFVQVGLICGDACTYEDYLRAAHDAINLGGDCVYCAASLDTISKLAAEGIPVVSHVGLIPSKRTWTGGFQGGRQDGGERDESLSSRSRSSKPPARSPRRSRSCRRASRREISKRTSLLLLSMGAGAGCDAQYLFAEDVLGYTRVHQPSTQRSIAIFAPSSTGCSRSASRRSRNISPM